MTLPSNQRGNPMSIRNVIIHIVCPFVSGVLGVLLSQSKDARAYYVGFGVFCLTFIITLCPKIVRVASDNKRDRLGRIKSILVGLNYSIQEKLQGSVMVCFVSAKNVSGQIVTRLLYEPYFMHDLSSCYQRQRYAALPCGFDFMPIADVNGFICFPIRVHFRTETKVKALLYLYIGPPDQVHNVIPLDDEHFIAEVGKACEDIAALL
jgi:hypothetical protein